MGKRYIIYAILIIMIIIAVPFILKKYKFGNQLSYESDIYDDQVELLFGNNFISHVIEDGQSILTCF